MKKFYIASSLKNKENVRFLSTALINEGFTNTYDWTLNENVTSIDQLRDIGSKELEAVMKSDFVVILFPAGKGSHVEMGIALGNGIHTYVYSSSEEIFDLKATTTFYHLDEVSKYSGSIDDFIHIIIRDQKGYL